MLLRELAHSPIVNSRYNLIVLPIIGFIEGITVLKMTLSDFFYGGLSIKTSSWPSVAMISSCENHYSSLFDVMRTKNKKADMTSLTFEILELHQSISIPERRELIT